MGINTLIILLFGGVGGALVLRDERRSPQDVIEDLSASEEPQSHRRLELARSEGTLVLSSELASMGLFTREESAKFLKRLKLIPFGAGFVVLLAFTLTSAADPVGTLLSGALGVLIGYLFSRRIVERKKARFQRDINFHLPLVMERIVMAVESGLDIVPSIKAIAELEETAKDPITKLLRLVSRLTESGLPFDESLSIVSTAIDSSALRHTFVHLGLAHKEGGDIMLPLRELSDATQLYFQEVVEEEIAKIPVKATLPLVITFAGLVLFFLTIPIVQLSTLASDAMVGHEDGLTLSGQ